MKSAGRNEYKFVGAVLAKSLMTKRIVLPFCLDFLCFFANLVGDTSAGITPTSSADENPFLSLRSLNYNRFVLRSLVCEEIIFALITALDHVNMEFSGLKIEQRAQGK